MRGGVFATCLALGGAPIRGQECELTETLGCFSDCHEHFPCPTRTVARAMSTLPTDPLHDNMTVANCALLCDSVGLPIAGLEDGSQCFCGSEVANTTANTRPASQCNTPCTGDAESKCGGPWRVQAYHYKVEDLVMRMDPTELISQLYQNGQDIVRPGLLLPRYLECLAGYDGGPMFLAPALPSVATSAFPHAVTLGCTWDPALVREVADAISSEARAVYHNPPHRPSLTCMSPVLNLARDPRSQHDTSVPQASPLVPAQPQPVPPALALVPVCRWGRSYESYSEDPLLVASYGAAYVAGLQYGDGTVRTEYMKVVGSRHWKTADELLWLAIVLSNTYSLYLSPSKVNAVPKHIAAYSVECFNPSGGPNQYPHCPVYRSNFNAKVSVAELYASYLPGWRAAVTESNATGAMCSYNSINGVPDCANGWLLRDTLQQAWGQTGYVISDADAVPHIYDPGTTPPGHNHSGSYLQAAADALLNGTTISLDSGRNGYVQLLPAALAKGLVSLADVQAAARRALLPRFQVGLYDPPGANPWSSIPSSVVEGPAHHALARRVAAAGIVLLTNREGGLPWSSQGLKVAVFGAMSNCTSCNMDRYTGHPATAVSMWQGIHSRLGDLAVPGGSTPQGAADALRAADVGVAVIGAYQEGESHDREDIGIPTDQLQMLTAAFLVPKPVVVVVVSGGMVDVEPALESAVAIVGAFKGGMEAGNALADVLFGDVNPSGALSATIYKRSWQNASNFLEMSMQKYPGRGYRWIQEPEHVLFPFGHGLSYSKFSCSTTAPGLSPPSISSSSLANGGEISGTVSLHNTGPLPGSRVVQLYLSRAGEGPNSGWPNEWLACFKKAQNVQNLATVNVQCTFGAQ
eukprot:gene3040-591_t